MSDSIASSKGLRAAALGSISAAKSGAAAAAKSQKKSHQDKIKKRTRSPSPPEAPVASKNQRKKQRQRSNQTMAKFNSLSDDEIEAWVWDYKKDDSKAPLPGRASHIAWLSQNLAHGVRPPVNSDEAAECLARYRTRDEASSAPSSSSASSASAASASPDSSSSDSEPEDDVMESAELISKSAPSHIRSPAAKSPSSSNEDRRCTHCVVLCPPGTPISVGLRFSCSNCGLLSGEPMDSRLNLILAAKSGAHMIAPASGQDSHAKKTTAASLTSLDTEIERLIAEGPSFPLYEDRSLKSVEDVLALGRKAAKGVRMAPPSERFLRLIQSGKLPAGLLGIGIPQSYEDIARISAAKAAGGRKVSLSEGSLVLAAEEAQARTVKSLGELTFAFVSTILPALFAQPAALADWAALLRTVHVLDKDHGWNVAYSYLVTQMSDKGSMRQPFGPYDETARPPVGAAAGRSLAAPSAYPSPKMSDRPAKHPIKDGVCYDYNFKTCYRGAECGHKHVCCWPECSESHIGKDCSHNPRKKAAEPGGKQFRRKAAPANRK